MTRQDKQLLLVDLCGRLPYGVKLLVEGWDSDRGCEFDTVETLIGIDDRFIYTIWDKTGDKDKHSIVEPLSILDYKPYLRPLSSMTEEEQKEFVKFHCVNICPIVITEKLTISNEAEMFDWLNAHHFDFRNLIGRGLAIDCTDLNIY